MECLDYRHAAALQAFPPTACFLGAKQNCLLSFPHYFFPHHMIVTSLTNKDLRKIPNIVIPQEKEFLADALLGQPKQHRWMILNLLREKNLLDSCLVNFIDGPWCSMKDISDSYSRVNPIVSSALQQLDEDEANIMRESGIFDSTTRFQKFGYHWFSQVIPSKIYDASWASIVAETEFQQDIFFPTEKIAKPLLAGRIFFVSSTRYYLRHLRDLGFETFDDVIDESYDQQLDYSDRTQAMMQSFNDFSRSNIRSIYQKVLPKLRHNQHVAINIIDAALPIKDLILDYSHN